ncbi:zinc ribbon domain-containing protein [Eubacterium xylanophilum]|uniref:zinc ribbon domain-containing protein n=1 Tax=Eubacterium xylanophilum TaxID=39497 RepID=UPI0004AC8141|nr:zinc ribbon domain-containing protein [Eubacterium xylanophilum]
MSIGSKLINAIGDGLSGYETIDIDVDQFFELLDRYFISKVENEQEYIALKKLVKGSMIKNIEMDSKDEKYHLCNTFINNRVGILSADTRYMIWISDKEKMKMYQFKAFSGKKLIDKVNRRIADYRTGLINKPVLDQAANQIESDNDDNLKEDASSQDEKMTQTKFCPECGSEISSSALFCSTCGASLKRVCPKCESDISETDYFCSACGFKLK